MFQKMIVFSYAEKGLKVFQIFPSQNPTKLVLRFHMVKQSVKKKYQGTEANLLVTKGTSRIIQSSKKQTQTKKPQQKQPPPPQITSLWLKYIMFNIQL